jgi:predicted nucleic acid-binding protein
VRIFLDTSVLLAACRSKSGASRAILYIAEKQGWKLIASPWIRSEVARNLSEFPFESTAIWITLRSRISLVDDLVSIDRALVFPASKDRPFLIKERNQGRLN